MSITYRSVKGSKLTSDEVDGNFQYLENLVGGAGNAITTQTGFSLVGQDLTINANWIWQILNISYTNASSVLINIPFASSGNQRIDLIVANQSNTFERIAGIESVSNPSAPSVPTNKIFVTFITVTDGTLSSPTPPITGSQFKQKNESRKFSAVLSGTDQVIEFRTAGHQHYEISGTVTSVAGFGKTLLLASPSAEIPYAGKDIFFENKTDHDVTLKDNFSGVDIKFDLGTDLVVPTNGIVWLKYDATAETLALFFKNWSEVVDISGKQDKVIIVTSNTTATNDSKYNVVATATFTDPASPVEGKGFEVFVRNGTATIGGTAYAVGSYVIRLYHSGSWTNTLVGGSAANTQIFHWWGGGWNTPTLGNYYYISFNSAAIEGLNNSISTSMNGRNKGLFITPFNCKIKRVMFKEGGSGAYTGNFVLASGLPNYGGTWSNGYTNVVTHLNQAISATGYEQHKYEFLVTDNITVPKGYAVCPMLVFSAQAQSNKHGIEILVEIEEVV